MQNLNNAECFIRKPITISDLVEEVRTAKDMKINIVFAFLKISLISKTYHTYRNIFVRSFRIWISEERCRR